MDAKKEPSKSSTSKAGNKGHVATLNFHRPMDINRPNDEDNNPTDVILAVQGLVGMGTHGFATEAAIPVDICASSITATSMTTSSKSSSSSHVSSINDAATTYSFNPSSISSYGNGTSSASVFSKLPSGAMSTFTALRNSMRPPIRQSEEHLLNNNKDECEGESDNEEKSTSRGSLARRRLRLKETPGGLLPSSASSATNRFLTSAILYEDEESRHHGSDMTGRLSSSSSTSLSSSSSSSSTNNSSTATTVKDTLTNNHPSAASAIKVNSTISNDNNASATVTGKSKLSGITSKTVGTGNDGSVGKASGASSNDICEQLQPKLVLIFDTYCQHTQQPRIDTSKPLLMLCLEHLVPFGCWVRETPNGCEWIREVGNMNIV